TNEQDFLQARLIRAGVTIHPLVALTSQGKGEATFACVYTGRKKPLPCGTLILCTGRLPDAALQAELVAQGITAARIGDGLTPSSVADAVYSAHRFARLLGEPDLPPRREHAPERSP
ncbi:MAG: NADH:flavin oxidoreductase, partial [Rhodobacter sp.]|nr:NADH:flavin oxidoreductase [Rhodobacter sp.]